MAKKIIKANEISNYSKVELQDAYDLTEKKLMKLYDKQENLEADIASMELTKGLIETELAKYPEDEGEDE